MRKAIFFASLVALFVACKKDEKTTYSDCGLILSIRERSDGGKEEIFMFSGCGADFQRATDMLNAEGRTIFYKGQTRPVAAYMVTTEPGIGTKGYYRYDNGSVPQKTIDEYTRLGRKPEVKQLTGMERANW